MTPDSADLAMQLLDITRQALLYRMEKHGIVFPTASAGDDSDKRR